MSTPSTAPCSAIPPAAVSWLWEPYLARGKLAILDGDPATGKTFLTLDLAARLSRGRPLPDGKTLARPHTTLFFSAEDDAADTLRPRAEAAGADLDRIIVSAPGQGDVGGLLAIPDDLAAVEQLVRHHRADLLVFDPLSAFLTATVTANNDPSVRRALSPLADLAARHQCAVLLIRHLNKYGGSKSLYRGLGSIGICGAIRTGLLLARHPDDPALRVLAQTKTNIGPPGPSLGFRLAPDDRGHFSVRWSGLVDLSADELCAVKEPVAQRPRERAAEWLRNQLASGPRKASELIASAETVGITAMTLQRAKKELDIRSELIYANEERAWLWSDPAAQNQSAGDEQVHEPLMDLGIDGCQSVDELLGRLHDYGMRGPKT